MKISTGAKPGGPEINRVVLFLPEPYLWGFVCDSGRHTDLKTLEVSACDCPDAERAGLFILLVDPQDHEDICKILSATG